MYEAHSSVVHEQSLPAAKLLLGAKSETLANDERAVNTVALEATRCMTPKPASVSVPERNFSGADDENDFLSRLARAEYQPATPTSSHPH